MRTPGPSRLPLNAIPLPRAEQSLPLAPGFAGFLRELVSSLNQPRLQCEQYAKPRQSRGLMESNTNTPLNGIAAKPSLRVVKPHTIPCACLYRFQVK